MIRCEVLPEYGCLCKVSICTQCVVNVRYKFKFNGGDKLHFGLYRLHLYVVINCIFVLLLRYISVLYSCSFSRCPSVRTDVSKIKGISLELFVSFVSFSFHYNIPTYSAICLRRELGTQAGPRSLWLTWVSGLSCDLS